MLSSKQHFCRKVLHIRRIKHGSLSLQGFWTSSTAITTRFLPSSKHSKCIPFRILWQLHRLAHGIKIGKHRIRQGRLGVFGVLTDDVAAFVNVSKLVNVVPILELDCRLEADGLLASESLPVLHHPLPLFLPLPEGPVLLTFSFILFLEAVCRGLCRPYQMGHVFEVLLCWPALILLLFHSIHEQFLDFRFCVAETTNRERTITSLSLLMILLLLFHFLLQKSQTLHLELLSKLTLLHQFLNRTPWWHL